MRLLSPPCGPHSFHQAQDIEPQVPSLPAIRPHLVSSWQLMVATRHVCLLTQAYNWKLIIVLAATGLNHTGKVILEEPNDATIRSSARGCGHRSHKPWWGD